MTELGRAYKTCLVEENVDHGCEFFTMFTYRDGIKGYYLYTIKPKNMNISRI